MCFLTCGSMRRESILRAPDGGDLAGLYREEGERLWRAVFAFARDREVASDAVAEAFAQCIRGGDRIREPRAWVWRAAFRIAAGELKERGRGVPLSTRTSYEMAEPPGRLLAALGSLSAHQRAALILRHYVGYETREIARTMGVAPTTVRVHMSRGRRRLRALLEEDDDRP